ncbi:MAG: alkaline phosphatase family protein [Acidobacteria bacterium]|nr:MAG: alkaline phosphatase family protein [Acidobacteriota bacterium]REK07697.1 MAG: alkaline phosphatase family protein [Acidobacteriota bacterium]
MNSELHTHGHHPSTAYLRPRRAISEPPRARRAASSLLLLALPLLALLPLAGCSSHPAPEGADRHSGSAAATATEPRSLVLISLDGFRWDQLDFPEATNLRALAESGVRADGLIPVFPTKTFPNHYSIVTGLYAQNHGIVSNNMRDPELGEFRLSDRDAVTDPRWWGGEPVWVTAARAGLTTAAMFWPGTEAEIRGVQPTHWSPFDSDVPFSDRVQQVLDWLALDPDRRPRFITLYFEQPDGTNHRHGPESAQAHATIADVDARIGELLRGLDELGARQRTDLVIVSDHGMAEIHSERVVVLEDLAEFEEGELFESGALVQIFPRPGREDLLFDRLEGAHPNLRVYRREELPPSFHMAGSKRIAPIVAVPDVGWEAVRRSQKERMPDGPLGGHHGPDPRDPRMHGLFVASGPSFVAGARPGRFENVHIYELLCRILEIPPAPNDGDPGALSSILAPRASNPRARSAALERSRP